jgi:hypothetical protein
VGRIRHGRHVSRIGKQGRYVEFLWDNFLKIRHLEEQDERNKVGKTTLAGDRLAMLKIFVLLYLKFHQLHLIS